MSSGGASTSGAGAGGGAAAPGAGGSGGARARGPSGVHPIVEYGCTAGFLGVVGTIVVGVAGSLTGRQQLYSRMLRARLVLVGTTLGLYVTGTGFFPVPPPITAIFGPPTRPPLQ